MTSEFKKIIDEDIEKCEEQIKKGNKESHRQLHGILISKYCHIINGFEYGLHSLFYDNNGTDCKNNLEIMKEKLILFKAMDYKNLYAKSDNSEITINNSNKLSVDFNISFSEAKTQIENMTSLKDEEINEIHKKIDELECIINSSDRKTTKWAKAKEIVKWVADKGVDVGITLLPLILKIAE